MTPRTRGARAFVLSLGFGFAAAVLAGCVSAEGVLATRVSNEFSCSSERVNVLNRTDIAYELYDVEACGQRGRYACVKGTKYVIACVREPDPPKWDPDPALVAKLGQVDSSSGAHWASVCQSPADRDCLSVSAEGSRDRRQR